MRFKLEKSKEQLNNWVLTDTENLVVIRFEEHMFNETQRVTVLDDSELLKHSNCANELAHIMSEMGDYMFSHWYSVAMPTPVFELRQDDEQDKLLLIRHKFPRFTVEIQDDATAKQLANSLNAACEFIKKKIYM